MKGKKGHTD